MEQVQSSASNPAEPPWDPKPGAQSPKSLAGPHPPPTPGGSRGGSLPLPGLVASGVFGLWPHGSNLCLRCRIPASKDPCPDLGPFPTQQDLISNLNSRKDLFPNKVTLSVWMGVCLWGPRCGPPGPQHRAQQSSYLSRSCHRAWSTANSQHWPGTPVSPCTVGWGWR